MTAASGLALAARAVGGLAVVLVLVLISARIARRSRAFGGSQIRVIERTGISKESQLAVVEVQGRRLLLGVGPQGITLISHLDNEMDNELDDELLALAPEALEPVDDVPAPVTEPTPEPAAPTPEPAIGAETEPLGRRARREARHAAEASPETAAEAPAAAEVRLPGAVNLDDYPDLASALRAAGRTTGTAPAPAAFEQALEQAGHDATQQAGSPNWIPAPRDGSAEATDLSHATSSAPVQPDPAAAPRGRRGKVRRAPQQRPEAVNGSVLSPATWRRGVEALRERTVRRG